MKQYCLHLTPVTPVHVGTGEELMPFQYFIKNIANPRVAAPEYRLIRFSDVALVQKMGKQDKEQLIALAKKDDLIKLRQFFIEKAASLVIRNQELIQSTSEVTSELLNLWEDLQKHPQNMLIIRPSIASALGGNRLVPYIPGSSLKGAIRTAIVDADQVGREHEKGKRGAHIANDPLRALLLADARFSGKGSRLVGAAFLYNRHKDTVESLQMMYEVLKGQCLISDKEQVQESTTMLTIKPELQREAQFDWNIPDIDEIARRCNQFYGDLLEEEYQDFYQNARDEVFAGFKFVHDAMDAVRKNKNEFLLRVGRHSQFEFMTLNNDRKCSNSKYNRTSRTLFKYKNGYYPMGWIHVRYEEVQ